MIYFTSDNHFNHAKIIEYCNRPFNNVDEMNKTLINNWNAKVNQDDIVYCLGDFTFREPDKFAFQLNGHIKLIPGNHDRKSLWENVCSSGKAEILPSLYDTEINGQLITMCHYSMRIWNKMHYGAWHIFGHSHGSLGSHLKSLDVGVDAQNMAPISFDELQQQMSKLQMRKIDHHG